MYTSLLYGIIKDNTSDILATLIECEIIPSFQKLEGWEGWSLVINRDNNRLTLLNFWHSKEDAIKVAKSGVTQEQFSKILPLLANNPNLDFFEPN